MKGWSNLCLLQRQNSLFRIFFPGSLTGWSVHCHTHCLHSVLPASLCSSPAPPPVDLSAIPRAYHQIREVFSKGPFASPALPLWLRHWAAGRHSAAQQSTIQPLQTQAGGNSLASPVGAGFFFVKKRDGTAPVHWLLGPIWNHNPKQVPLAAPWRPVRAASACRQNITTSPTARRRGPTRASRTCCSAWQHIAPQLGAPFSQVSAAIPLHGAPGLSAAPVRAPGERDRRAIGSSSPPPLQGS